MNNRDRAAKFIEAVYETGFNTPRDIAEYLDEYDGMTDVFYFDGDPTHRQWKSEWEEL